MLRVQEVLDPIGLFDSPPVASASALKVKEIFEKYNFQYSLVGPDQRNYLYTDLKSKINGIVSKDVLLRLVIFYEARVVTGFLDFWRFLEGCPNVAQNAGLIGVDQPVGTEQFIEVVKKAISKSEVSSPITDDEFKAYRVKMIRKIHAQYIEAYEKSCEGQITRDKLNCAYRLFKIKVSGQLTPQEVERFARICNIPSSTLDCLGYKDGSSFINKKEFLLDFSDPKSVKDVVEKLVLVILCP